MPLLKRLFRFAASFGFAATILLFLFLLTWLGTLEQIKYGLYETQKKYFESYLLVHHAGPWAVQWPWADANASPLMTLPAIPIPLPGVNLLLTLLMVNLFCGGLVRLRKDFARAGILVTHLGIVLMLAAGFVNFRWAHEGLLHVEPGQSNRHYFSYHDWDLTIRDAAATGRVTEHVIPGEEWRDLVKGTRRFTSDALPFDLLVTKTFKNCDVLPQGPMFKGDGPVIDRHVVSARPLNDLNEQNVPGAYVTAVEKATGRQIDGIVWGFERQPLAVEAGGKQWLLELSRRRYELPFDVRLEKIFVEFHPGTASPRTFWSNITKLEDSQQLAMRITMNEPLRHAGYTLFQTGWGPQTRPLRPMLYSEFTVVENPSDQWPKWSCCVIGIGLLFHFGMRLWKYITASRRLLAAPAKD